MVIPETTIKRNMSRLQLKELIDQFLSDSDEEIKAFLQVLEHFVDVDDNERALDYEAVRDYAISKTSAYNRFLNRFLENKPGFLSEIAPETNVPTLQ